MIRSADIIQIVSLATGVDVLDIVSERRTAGPTRARYIAIHLCKSFLPDTLQEIGNVFGGRDHSSIKSALARLEKEMETDETLAALVRSLSQTIEYRVTLEALGKVDVLGVARAIALNPGRGSIAASTTELAALAVFTLDLWEVASCAEAMAQSLLSDPDEEDPQLPIFAAAIIDEMNHIAGPAPALLTSERTEQ